MFQRIKSLVLTKKFGKQVALIIGVYILVIGATMLYLSASTNHGQKIEVPSLMGKNVKNIQPIVESLGLSYEVLDSIFDPTKPQGTIVFQDPGGTKQTNVYVKEGRVIKLRVSKKTKLVEMPHLVHRSQRFAESVLKNRGIKFTISYEPTREADGAVLNQLYKGKFIPEGTKLPVGSTIQLIVGKNAGGEPVQIPNLIGLTINEVRERLGGLNGITLYIACPDCQTAADSAAVRVFSQSPEFMEGMLSPPGTTVTVTMKRD